MSRRAAHCQCDFDPSYTGGLCDACGKPEAKQYPDHATFLDQFFGEELSREAAE